MKLGQVKKEITRLPACMLQENDLRPAPMKYGYFYIFITEHS